MKQKSSIWSSVVATATELLAVGGLIALIYSVLSFFEEPISRRFEKILSGDAVVRPVCEDYVDHDVVFRDGTRADLKLIGLQIKTYKDLSDIKFRFEDIAYIEKVIISSNGITESDALAFTKSLPRGTKSLKDPIFASLPRLLSNSKVTVHILGIPSPRFECEGSWFEVSAPERSISHLVFADVLTIRGTNIGVGGNIYKFLFIATLIALLVVIVVVRARGVFVIGNRTKGAKGKGKGKQNSRNI